MESPGESSLLGDRFAPSTCEVGFLEAPLPECVRALETWRTQLLGECHRLNLDGSLGEFLPHLAPLVAGARPRELMVEVGDWTAYFDCLVTGTDAQTAIGYLAKQLGCAGVTATAWYRSPKRTPTKVSFQLFAPIRTGFLNVVRTVYVAKEGRRLRFSATGTPQRFEDEDAYRARAVSERFTGEMLGNYCHALGIERFDASRYGPHAVLIESPAKLGPAPRFMSFEEAQRHHGIVPAGAL